jgi:type II secretory ATPase GspE/PulE/Tfp pilus assembly ATPase PilB-like protein
MFVYGQTGSGKTFTMEGYKYSLKGEGNKPKIEFPIGEE